MAKKELKCAGYIRVSGMDQVKGTSLEDQEDKIRKYCVGYDYELVNVYKDKAKTGTKIDARPELLQMIADGKAGKFEKVVFRKMSRFGRNARDILNLFHEFESMGISLVSIDEQFDTGTSMGKVVRTMLAAFAELDRDQTVEKLAGGKRYLLEKGIPWQFTKEGDFFQRPYGRTVIVNGDKKDGDVEWILIPEEVEKIQHAAALIVNERYSLKRAAEAVGLKIPHLHKTLRTRCGPTWEQAGKTFNIPPLLSDDTIKAVKEALKTNRRGSGVRAARKYLLGGMIFGADGRAMDAMTQQKSGVKYYRHNRPHWALRQEWLDTAVLDSVALLLSSKEEFVKAVYSGDRGTRRERLEADIKELQKEAVKIDKRRDRLIELYADAAVGKIDAVKKKLETLKEQDEQVATRLRDKQAALDNLPHPKTIERQRQEMLTKLGIKGKTKREVVYELLQRLPFDDKRKLCQLCFQGKDEDDRRYGVYVDHNKEKGVFPFLIRGLLANVVGMIDKADPIGFLKQKRPRLIWVAKDVPQEIKNAYTRIPGKGDLFEIWNSCSPGVSGPGC